MNTLLNSSVDTKSTIYAINHSPSKILCVPLRFPLRDGSRYNGEAARSWGFPP
ncbi:hypothetical protein [Nostoc sp. LPT]|uniref:hypothetical protein n=1 Tax=Nostoc sp. LPT TaxID=2815387 RepID=UPI001D61411B|nr:hypothetical protein [Nostoc sp. LPT]MBN4001278.1 hypothetical protein [Nostoc sp. LPT]